MSIPIRGPSHGSVGAAFETAKRRGAQRLDFLLDYLKALYADAAAVNVRADLLVAQWDLETGSGTSTYWTRDGNPAGIAAFDDGSNWGLTFTPSKAARGHVTHILAYLGVEPPNGWKQADARWQAVVNAGYYGSVDTTADLGNGRWATDPKYAEKIEARHAAYSFAPPVTPQNPKENTDMAITYHKVPMFGYLDRPISKPEGKGWNNLGQRDILGVVLHRMLGSLWGTDGYFRLASVNALTDYGLGVAATDGAGNAGVILKWNDPLGFRAGWASGPVSAPYGDGRTFVNKYGINAVNRRLVSLEISGNQTTVVDATALDEIVHFIAWHADRAKISWEAFPLYHVTGMSFLFYHDEFCFGSGKRCPFEAVKALINTIIAKVKAFLKKYQTGGVSVPAPNPQPQPVPNTTGIKIGDWVTFDGEYNVRRAWNTDEYFDGKKNVVKVTSAGEKARIIAGPNVNDGYTWMDVEIPGFGTGHVIVDGMSKTDAPAPPAPPEKMWKDPAPVPELAVADPDTASDFTISNGTNFRPVFDEVKAVRQGKQRRFAIEGESVDVIGPDYKPGDQFTAMYRFTNNADVEYYYLSNHARVHFADFERISDTPIED